MPCNRRKLYPFVLICLTFLFVLHLSGQMQKAHEKFYSRNLGTGDGIELIWVKPSETGILEKEAPNQWDIVQNYPNPFNQGTTIVSRVSEPGDVVLSLVNCKG